jgi:hypothetical protein
MANTTRVMWCVNVCGLLIGSKSGTSKSQVDGRERYAKYAKLR